MAQEISDTAIFAKPRIAESNLCGHRSYQLLASEHGAGHIMGMILLLVSIYSTILMFQQGFESKQLVETVIAQKKKIEMMELKLQVLELRVRR